MRVSLQGQETRQTLSPHSLSFEAVDDPLFDSQKRCSDSRLPERLPQTIGECSFFLDQFFSLFTFLFFCKMQHSLTSDQVAAMKSSK